MYFFDFHLLIANLITIDQILQMNYYYQNIYYLFNYYLFH